MTKKSFNAQLTALDKHILAGKELTIAEMQTLQNIMLHLCDMTYTTACNPRYAPGKCTGKLTYEFLSGLGVKKSHTFTDPDAVIYLAGKAINNAMESIIAGKMEQYANSLQNDKK